MLNKVLHLSLASLVLGASVLSGCAADTGESTDATENALSSAPEVGVLLGSHCDIDNPDTELEPYVKSAFLKNDGIPLPDWLRSPLQGVAYSLSYNTVRGQYDAMGGATHYRANGKLQADAVTAALKAAGINGKAYLGCDFTWPTIPEALAQMQKDGVKKVVLFNKGAQYSIATGGEHMEDAQEFLKHSTWKPEQFVMVKEFSSDPRFRQLLGDVIQRDVDAAFPGAPKADVCILVASHGLPLRLVKMGDRATTQMLEVVDVLKKRFSAYDIRHGFLNDDFFPGAEWTTPKAIDVAYDMRQVSCPNVFMDSRLSFTTHHRATLYDLNVEARATLEEPDLGLDGQPHPLYTKPKIVFGKQFDAEPGLAKLFAALTKEAIAGKNSSNLVNVTSTTKVPLN
jgi:protoheme ferro-lyase